MAFTNVKTWTGTVSVEAAGNPARILDLSYSATGNLTITDEMSTDPQAIHRVAVPSPAETADPKRAANAFKRWPAHVVFASHTTGIDDLGNKVDFTCQADQTTLSLVQLMITPMQAPSLRIQTPVANATCTGSRVSPVNWSPNELTIDIMLPAARGPLKGTKTFALGDAKATVTYQLTPS